MHLMKFPKHMESFFTRGAAAKNTTRCNISFASSRSRTVAYISYFLLRQLILRHCYYLTIWTQLQSCASHLEILYIVYITDLYIISLLNKIKVILQNEFYFSTLQPLNCFLQYIERKMADHADVIFLKLQLIENLFLQSYSFFC